jgi:hypothetical protein
MDLCQLLTLNTTISLIPLTRIARVVLLISFLLPSRRPVIGGKRHLWHFVLPRNRISCQRKWKCRYWHWPPFVLKFCSLIGPSPCPGGHFDWRYIWLAVWQVVLVAVNQTVWECFFFFFFNLFACAKVERNGITL